MSEKDAFWQAIDDDLPESIANLVSQVIDVTNISPSSTVDEAIKKQGQLADMLIQILSSLNGLSLVELALRIGQRNVTAKHLLFAGLEYLGAVAGMFTVTQPQPGQEYDQNPLPFEARAEDDASIEQIDVLVDGTETLTLTGTGGVFTGQSIMTPGGHTAVFSSPQLPDKSITVHFSMIEFQVVTYPADGDTVIGPVIAIAVKAAATSTQTVLQSASATFTGISGASQTTCALVLDAAQGAFTGVADLSEALANVAADASATLAMEVRYMATGAAQQATKLINFVINKTYE